MKKYFCLILSTVLMLTFLGCGKDAQAPAETTEPQISDLYEWEDVEGGVQITKYKGSATKIKIPAVIESKAVVSIGLTFSGNMVIEEIELPESVISANFAGCKNLVRLTAHGDIKISEFVMTDCTSLKYLCLDGLTTIHRNLTLRIPNSVEELDLSGLEGLSLYCFSSGSALKKIDLSSVKQIVTEYYSWDADLQEVILNPEIKYYAPASYSNRDGSYPAGSIFDDSVEEKKRKEITEKNSAQVFCEIFQQDTIIINGVTYQYSGK